MQIVASCYEQASNDKETDEEGETDEEAVRDGENKTDNEHVNVTWTSLPRDILQRNFQDTIQKWEGERHPQQLQTALTAISRQLALDKVVAFACGSLGRFSEISYRSMTQHALLLTLRSCLPQGIGSCYIQDPAYTQVDKDILEEVGFQVVDDPGLFLMADEFSIVVSVCPNIPVKQIITDICRPGIIIWDKTSLPYPW